LGPVQDRARPEVVGAQAAADRGGRLVRTHAAPLVLFACATIGWTWPLVRHLATEIPGEPGDNFSFLWNLWWMRHVRATPGLSFFRTDYLLYPIGTSLVDHPHTALPAWISATLLSPLPVAAAQNVLLLFFVFANFAAMYLLAWDMTRHRRASVFAALLFGMSPYFAAHLRGHYDLVAAWTLPAFLLALRHAFGARSIWPAVVAGALLAVTTYTAYYYTVYLGLLALAYLAGGPGGMSGGPTRRPSTATLRRVQIGLAALLAVLSVSAVWIAATGGTVWTVLGVSISARTPQNILSLMWLTAAAWLLVRNRLTLRLDGGWARRDVYRFCLIAAVFLIGVAPLLSVALRLVAHGGYVSQTYYWRSGPGGIDAVAPLLGSPFHSLTGTLSSRAYARLGLDRIEGVAWIGLVPLAVLAFRRSSPVDRVEARRWWIVAATFAVWSLGPILTVAGHDTGLRLPEIAARFVPVVANARMPGRGMVVVYLALGLLAALRLARSTGRWSTPGAQWLLVALLVLDYTDAPIAMTMLDRPVVYQRLAEAPPGAVCEVPFGIGDGLGGVGSQQRRTLYYATIHQHPLVGGYIGRLPPGVADAYARMPIVGTLLALSSSGGAARRAADDPRDAPCRYLVVDRETTPPALMAFVQSLPIERLATDDARDLYQFSIR
jgi:hypothetical protein